MMKNELWKTQAHKALGVNDSHVESYNLEVKVGEPVILTWYHNMLDSKGNLITNEYGDPIRVRVYTAATNDKLKEFARRILDTLEDDPPAPIPRPWWKIWG